MTMDKREIIRVYIDAQGVPVQELSAICVKNDWTIYSAFHQYAACLPKPDPDWYSRRYVHGLRKWMLKYYGVPTEDDLIHVFEEWLSAFPSEYNYIFLSNDPTKVNGLLPTITVYDICLPPWKERVKLSSYEEAINAKREGLTICGKTCRTPMHSAYIPLHRSECFLSPTSTQYCEENYNCSLYNALEYYFYDKNYECTLPSSIRRPKCKPPSSSTQLFESHCNF